ncbi:MAG: UDP-glucose/GDP-mannose dehydrogenase family protein [Deltaproteobacteria bacterium]|nr:UDP-glucose/GDP-mannose dehydrogenase family protein [Deltaproteobacteria bacterium]MBW2360327.1 UDP-glucose/GDP-mannose dehydrogenase family protein [Deltaproteobacteria bacterium]
MNICVIGTGYVGLVSGACFAEFGLNVVCADKDAGKIDSLEQGEIPIYEPGLDTLVKRNVAAGRLAFTTETPVAVESSLVVMIAVPTPAAPDGSTDLGAVEAVAREVGRHLSSYKVVVTKSTVPVGTAGKVRGWIQSELDARGADTHFSVASNPEFLREGAAINDFLRPDRVVVGTEDDQAEAILKDLYRPLFLNETPVVLTDVATAELTKYAANAFLATKISFINEIANLCEEVGADVQKVARGMGLDRRIGAKFLHAGPGFGGSCFPKDTRSLAHFSRERGSSLQVVEAVIRVNEAQRERMLQKVVDVLDDRLEGRTISVLGISFKPETDDIRDAPALDIIRGLQERGAKVQAFDPQAMDIAADVLPGVEMCEDAYAACRDADALVLVTEWNQFRMLDLGRVKKALRSPLIVDLRNVYDPKPMRAQGFVYVGVGR